MGSWKSASHAYIYNRWRPFFVQGCFLLFTWGPFCYHGLTLIPAWMTNYTHYKVWDEITYPFPNFNGCTVEVWEWISSLIPHFTVHVITYSCWDKSWTMLVKGQNLCTDTFKCILLRENVCILIQISLKCVPKDPIVNKAASVQVVNTLTHSI